MLRIAILAAAVLLLACGGKSAEDQMIGTWSYGGMVEIEYRDNGITYLDGIEDECWKVIEGDPPVIRFTSLEDGSLEEEYELTFEGNRVIFTHESGMTINLERVDR